MLNRRGALCAGRSTVVVVVLLLGSFITFDSYTYRLFSTVSKSVPPDFFSSSSKDNIDSTSSSRATESGHKSMSDVEKDDDLTDTALQVVVEGHARVEANQPPNEQLKSPSQERSFGNTESRGAQPEFEGSTYNSTVSRTGGVPKQQEAGFKHTRIFSNLSQPHSVNDSGRSSEANLPGNDQTWKYFNESEPQSSKDVGSLNRNDPLQNDQTRYHINGSESHIVKETGRVTGRDSFSASTIAAANTTVSQLANIKRVELDLWQARMALKQVVLAQVGKNETGGGNSRHASNGPEGEAYKNAALFRQSYREMEDRFKIYIYQEGEVPLVHDGPCKEIYAVEGRFIQELQDNNPFVTSDPEEAHVFFLPFSVSMMVTYLYIQNSGDMSPLLRFVQDYVHVIADKYPQWNRSEGADHFMLSCHDWGPYVSRVDSNLYSKSIRVLCNANTSEGFVPYKDASLPEIHLVGGEVQTALGGLPVSARTYLAFFAGGDHGPVRPELFKYWEGKDSDILVHRQVPSAGLTYHEYMKRSKFCLCPGGYEVNSPRVVEAIYNDCIPVIIADKFVLPFSDVLDWSKFSLQVLEADIPRLKSLLEAVPPEALVRMQNRVKQVRKHFLLNQPPEKYDVFHMILHSVWLRRLNVRLLG